MHNHQISEALHSALPAVFQQPEANIRWYLVKNPVTDALGLPDRFFTCREDVEAEVFGAGRRAPIPRTVWALFAECFDGTWTVSRSDCTAGPSDAEGILLGWITTVPDDGFFDFERDAALPLAGLLGDVLPMNEEAFEELAEGLPETDSTLKDDGGNFDFDAAESYGEAVMKLMCEMTDRLKDDAERLSEAPAAGDRCRAECDFEVAGRLLSLADWESLECSESFLYVLAGLRNAYRRLEPEFAF